MKTKLTKRLEKCNRTGYIALHVYDDKGLVRTERLPTLEELSADTDSPTGLLAAHIILEEECRRKNTDYLHRALGDHRSDMRTKAEDLKNMILGRTAALWAFTILNLFLCLGKIFFF